MARPRSLRFRYTLRALLVFITLFMLWGGYHTNRSWKERAAEEILRRQGASINYGPTQAGTGAWSEVRFRYQKLMQAIWRERFITYVDDVTLEPEVVDALLALPHLERLGLLSRRWTQEESGRMNRGTYVPERKLPRDVLERLLRTHDLQYIFLGAWVVSDEDCRLIAQHRSVKVLRLVACDFPEGGLAELVTLPKLNWLEMDHCRVNDHTLDQVSGSPSLKVVDFRWTPVGIAFARFVGRCPNLSRLRCDPGLVGDEFVAAIGPHPALEDLDLGYTKMTDQSLAVLQKMPSLQAVTIAPSNLTDKAKAEFLQAKPSLRIR